MSCDFSACRVLIVDDNPLNREVALHLLASLGCKAQAVSDGRQALAAHADRHFDLILMDCAMPGLDGFETTRRLRAGEAPRRSMVVALTARADAEQEALCRAAGMNGMLAKPLRLSALQEVLVSCLALTGIAPAMPSDLPAEDQIEAVRDVFGQDFPGLARLYLRDGGPRMAGMRQACGSSEAVQLARLAHLLGGSSTSIGANGLGEWCRRLEAAAATESWEDAMTLLAAIESEFDRVCAKLHALLAAHPS